MLRCDNPFWNFSLAVYAQPGVAPECLALQNALNIDVNVLLFCAWLGSDRKVILNRENFDAIDAHARRWHDTVVRPLRAVRQAMKPMPEMANDAVKDLRKDIAAVELRAEQVEQALLFEKAAALCHGAAASDSIEAAVRANIAAFVRRNATDASGNLSAPFLIAAAIDYLSAPTIKNP